MSEIKIGRMVMGPVSTNCYFVYKEDEKKAIIFDPPTDGAGIYKKLLSSGIVVSAIMLTHGHFDHIMGVNALRQSASVKVYAYEEEKDVCESSSLNCSDMIGQSYIVKCNKYLKDNEEVEIEDMKIKVIGTPGHTKGSCCYYFEDAKLLISGDTLFQCSIGRTDLPTGSESNLIRNLHEKLMLLPDDVKVYPGHGDYTSIGFERINNPFV